MTSLYEPRDGTAILLFLASPFPTSPPLNQPRFFFISFVLMPLDLYIVTVAVLASIIEP